jgi:hypothetical protein
VPDSERERFLLAEPVGCVTSLVRDKEAILARLLDNLTLPSAR